MQLGQLVHTRTQLEMCYQSPKFALFLICFILNFTLFFLGCIFKLNLESRGMFTELSYLNIILTIINIIMLSVRRMLDRK